MRRFEGWQSRPHDEVSVVALATMAALAETVSHLAATDGLKEPARVASQLADDAVRALTPSSRQAD